MLSSSELSEAVSSVFSELSDESTVTEELGFSDELLSFFGGVFPLQPLSTRHIIIAITAIVLRI